MAERRADAVADGTDGADRASAQPDQRRRRRGLVLAAAGVVGLVVVAAGVVLSTQGGGRADDAGVPEEGEVLERPEGWPKPDGRLMESTASYLAGDGAPVVEVISQAEVLVEGPGDGPACQAVADATDAVVDPDLYRLLAAGVPDPVLAELALSLGTLLSDALVACLDEGTLGDTEAPLGRAVEATALRRTELEA